VHMELRPFTSTPYTRTIVCSMSPGQSLYSIVEYEYTPPPSVQEFTRCTRWSRDMLHKKGQWIQLLVRVHNMKVLARRDRGRTEQISPYTLTPTFGGSLICRTPPSPRPSSTNPTLALPNATTLASRPASVAVGTVFVAASVLDTRRSISC
jgi:hypothetical protein